MTWRNMEIYKEHKAGMTQSELAEKYSISQARASQIIRDMVYKLETRPAKSLTRHDQNVALFGSWVHKVNLLLPHLEAIKAIAEEKDKALDDKPAVKSYCGGKPNYCTPEETPDVDAENMTQDCVDETAKSEHEPVAWAHIENNEIVEFETDKEECEACEYCVPLYAAPPKKEWVGLTDEDLVDCESEEDVQFVKRIEAKLKEKNGG